MGSLSPGGAADQEGKASLLDRPGLRSNLVVSGSLAWLEQDGIRVGWGPVQMAAAAAAAGLNGLISDWDWRGSSTEEPETAYLPVIGGPWKAAQSFVATGPALASVAVDLQRRLEVDLQVRLCAEDAGRPGREWVTIPLPAAHVSTQGAPVSVGLEPPVEVEPGRRYYLVLQTAPTEAPIPAGQAYSWRVADTHTSVYEPGEKWGWDGQAWQADPQGLDFACILRFTAGGDLALSPLRGPVNTGGLPPGVARDLQVAAAQCQAAGIHLFLRLPGGAAGLAGVGRALRAAVQADGQTTDRPCPRDRRWWDTAFFQVARSLAELSTESPLAGVVLDLEMASERDPFYSDQDCFCDFCFFSFARSQRRKDLLRTPPADRYRALQDRKLLASYYRALEAELVKIGQQFRRDLDQCNPEFLVGLRHARFAHDRRLAADQWVYRGLVKGLSRPTVPILLFTSSLALAGHRDDQGAGLAEAFQRWQEEGLHFVCLSGLPLNEYPPAQLQPLAAKLIRETNGFWVFPLGRLQEDPATVPEAARLPGSPEDYWAALKAASAAGPTP